MTEFTGTFNASDLLDDIEVDVRCYAADEAQTAIDQYDFTYIMEDAISNGIGVHLREELRYRGVDSENVNDLDDLVEAVVERVLTERSITRDESLIQRIEDLEGLRSATETLREVFQRLNKLENTLARISEATNVHSDKWGV